ncbi:MAG: tetratricopeptide repeat protein [Burkholderiales bacterium]|nr:tetratricopeptide repeat protein [Burkholderiales bacterium]
MTSTSWPDGHLTMLYLEPAPEAPELSTRRQKVLIEALEGVCAEHGGRSLRKGRIGFLAVFPSARRALDCSLEIQKATARSPLGQNLRSVAHTVQDPQHGFAQGDYSGPDLDKTLKVAGLANPGQILVTNAARRSCAQSRELDWKAWRNRALGEDGLLETLWELLLEGVSRGEPGGGGREILGLAWQAVGRGGWEEAHQGFRSALERLRRAADRQGQALALNSLGAVLSRLERPQEAEKAFQEARNYAREVGDHELEALALQNLGILHFRAGRLQEAETLLTSCRHLRERMLARRGLARCLRLEAMVRRRAGDLSGAAESLDSSLEASEETQEARELACGWWARGLLDQDLGDQEAAETHLRKALEYAVAIEDRTVEARVLSNLGLLGHLQAQHARASRMHRSAQTILQEEGDSRALLRARVNAAASLLARGKTAETRKLLEECFDLGRAAEDQEVVGVALANLASLMDQGGDWAPAITVARRAAQILGLAGREDLQARVRSWLEEWAPGGGSPPRDQTDHLPI